MKDPTTDAREHEALLAAILRSKEFEGTTEPGKILGLLFDRRCARKGTSRRQIALEVESNEEAISSAINDKKKGLRARLTAYQESLEGQRQKWVCELLPGEGHKLVFTLNPNRPITATERFWNAHFEPRRPVTLVGDDMLFFFDLEKGWTFRFFDTNVVHIDNAMEELRRRHHDVQISEGLRPAYAYEGVGQRAASDHLAAWFAEKGVHAAKASSRSVSRPEVLEGSPVLIGHVRTNPYIFRFLNHAEECNPLRFRLDHERFGGIEIRDIDAHETKALERFIAEKTDRGVLLLGTKRDEWLGVVIRIPNPGRNGGVVTIIASDVEFVFRQIAAALTDDDRMMEFMQRMGWPLEKRLPSSFEMLFSVKLSPGGLTDEASAAELLAGDQYDD